MHLESFIGIFFYAISMLISFNSIKFVYKRRLYIYRHKSILESRENLAIRVLHHFHSDACVDKCRLCSRVDERLVAAIFKFNAVDR